MPDDPSAALAEFRKRQEVTFDDPAGKGRPNLILAVKVARDDVPRLLAALDAALSHHQRVPLYGNASTEENPDACPHDPERDWACHFEDPDSGEWLCEETTAGAVCSCTESPDGERIPWPCDEVAAILAALKGEGDAI